MEKETVKKLEGIDHEKYIAKLRNMLLSSTSDIRQASKILSAFRQAISEVYNAGVKIGYEQGKNEADID